MFIIYKYIYISPSKYFIKYSSLSKNNYYYVIKKNYYYMYRVISHIDIEYRLLLHFTVSLLVLHKSNIMLPYVPFFFKVISILWIILELNNGATIKNQIRDFIQLFSLKLFRVTSFSLLYFTYFSAVFLFLNLTKFTIFIYLFIRIFVVIW